MTCTSVSFFFQKEKVVFPTWEDISIQRKGRLFKNKYSTLSKTYTVILRRHAKKPWCVLVTSPILFRRYMGTRVLKDFSVRTISFSIFVRTGFSFQSCINHRNSPATGFSGGLIILKNKGLGRFKGGDLRKLQY